jgi:hypothetical protein
LFRGGDQINCQGVLNVVAKNYGGFPRDPREHWLKPRFQKIKWQSRVDFFFIPV